jgi:hypothetical protein
MSKIKTISEVDTDPIQPIDDLAKLMATNINDPLRMTSMQYKELFLQITKVLKIIEISSNKENKKLFVDGEFDSNVTTFEHLSDELEIGVHAYSHDVGYCLLALLRMIIDERFDLLNLWISDDEIKIGRASCRERVFGLV